MDFTIPRPGNKDRDDQLGKDDLIDALIVVRVKSFAPDAQTKYGITATLEAHVTVVDGQHKGAVEPEFFCAGNLARQIGEGLDVGATCPGRIRKGKSPSGREWYGIAWALDPVDQKMARDALTGLTAPATGKPDAGKAAPPF